MTVQRLESQMGDQWFVFLTEHLSTMKAFGPFPSQPAAALWARAVVRQDDLSQNGGEIAQVFVARLGDVEYMYGDRAV